MAAPPPPNQPPIAPPPPPPPIALPAPPNDLNVALPAAPVFPPSTVNDVLSATRFRRHVDVSHIERPLAVRSTPNDQYNSILYEHGVVAQAVAVAGPQGVAPPWFQGAMQQLELQVRTDIQNDVRVMIRSDIHPDLRREVVAHEPAQGRWNRCPIRSCSFR